MSAIVVRPIFWYKSAQRPSMIQLLDVERYPAGYVGTRRSICGNGVKSGPLKQATAADVDELGVCSQCLSVLRKGDYLLEDGSLPLTLSGQLNLRGPLAIGARLRPSPLAA